METPPSRLRKAQGHGPRRDAERRDVRSHAERGNERTPVMLVILPAFLFLAQVIS